MSAFSAARLALAVAAAAVLAHPAQPVYTSHADHHRALASSDIDTSPLEAAGKGGTSGSSTPIPAPALLPTGTRLHVLVMLATWSQPDATTVDGAAQQFFNDDDAWFRAVSDGRLGLTGQVTPWLTIAGPTPGHCLADREDVMTQAKTAAAAQGFDLTAFDHFVVYFPQQTTGDCAGYGGFSYVPGTETWLNGHIDRGTTVHELGHDIGLHHAGTLTCTNGGSGYTVNSGSCTSQPYGDPTDVMGGYGDAAGYAADHESQLGWLNGRVADLTQGGSLTLQPYEASSGPAAVSIDAGNGRTYWVEYRTATGADKRVPRKDLNVAIIHMTDPAYGGVAELLDMSPDGNFSDAGLSAGRSWTSPEGITIAVGRVSKAGLPVSVVR